MRTKSPEKIKINSQIKNPHLKKNDPIKGNYKTSNVLILLHMQFESRSIFADGFFI